MAQIISLWTYSCNLYQQERVKRACLYLQESYDIDVTALLFCCWFSAHYQPLNASQIMEFTSQVRLWSEHCIRPLRRIRQQMKPLAGNAVDPKTWQQVREQVKTLELEAEKQLLVALERQVFDFPDLYRLRDSSCEAISDDTVDLLYGYFSIATMRDDTQAIEAFGDILHAAYPQMQYHSALQKFTNREVSA